MKLIPISVISEFSYFIYCSSHIYHSFYVFPVFYIYYIIILYKLVYNIHPKFHVFNKATFIEMLSYGKFYFPVDTSDIGHSEVATKNKKAADYFVLEQNNLLTPVFYFINYLFEYFYFNSKKTSGKN